MTKILWKKRVLSLTLAVLILLGAAPFALAAPGDAGWYEISVNEADGFAVVTNPNGGETLSYSLTSGVQLLSVQDGANTYAFKDLNKNGSLDIYEDWRATDAERAADLAGKMIADPNGIEQIAGLMMVSMHQSGLTPALTAAQKELIDTQNIRSLLNADTTATTATTAKWSNAVQAYAESLGWGIPANITSDPRSNAAASEYYDGSTASLSKWPSNLGLAATFDPEVVKQHGVITSQEYRALGINTALSPQIDLGTEPRWNRINGTFGEGPLLASDLTAAYVAGFQSTYVDGVDMGWGKDSVTTMIKHWPGDGVGEGGRESHANVGKYAVFPGGAFKTHLEPFQAGLSADLVGKTGGAAAVMPSYSIAIDENGASIGEAVGSGYSNYKLAEVLRGDLGFDGIICSDWLISGMWSVIGGNPIMIWGGMAWGVDTSDGAAMVLQGIMAGLDEYGGLQIKAPIVAAYNLGVTKYGKDTMDKRFGDTARRVLLNEFRLGLFEDPYLNVEASAAFVGQKAFMDVGYEAQLKSIVMLKNSDSIIQERETKPTVYIPQKLVPFKAAVIVEGVIASPAVPAHYGLAFAEDFANDFFVVKTDTIREGADPENPQADDIIALTDFADVDFAIVKVTSPTNVGDMFSGYGYLASQRNVPGEAGYDAEEPLSNGYIPKSLQYRPYTADPAVVRAKPLSYDPAEDARWVAAGGEAGMSRYYGGKSTTTINESDLDLILNTVSRAKVGLGEDSVQVPVVVAVQAENPMCFYEFEDQVDGIVLAFGASDQAMLEVVAGKYNPQGLLPFQMPANMTTVEQQLEDIPFDMVAHTDENGGTYNYAFGMNWAGKIEDERVAKYAKPFESASKTLTGTYSFIAEGYDWGPAVPKIIVSLDDEINQTSVDASDFSVVVTKQAMFGVETQTRTVLDAYTSDAAGNRLDGNSSFVTLELRVSPTEGSPFTFLIDFQTWAMANVWSNPYNNAITLTAGSMLGAGLTLYDELAINPVSTGKTLPIADEFTKHSFAATDGTALTYAAYAPPADDKKNALIVWLHGGGEGGTNPEISILGNKAVALADSAIQGIFDGAYVLAPQTPRAWMTWATDESGAPINGKSIYTESLQELIASYVAANDDIDVDRVIVGGCSNGGYMTLKLLEEYPDFYAAGYPICEGYLDAVVPDSTIDIWKELPIWMTWAANDTTLPPAQYSLPTVARLIAAGAKDLVVSEFPGVFDTTGLYKDAEGNPYEYMGHWSWLYVFNNECVAEVDGQQTTIWEWLATKSRSAAPVLTSVSVSTPTIVETLPANLNLTVVGENLDGAVAYLSVNDQLLYPAPVVGGAARMHIDAAPEAGTYALVVVCGSASVACDIDVVEYDTGIWAGNAFVEEGKLQIRFNEALTLKKTAGCVLIAGTAYNAAVLSDKLTVEVLGYDATQMASGTKIVISGVKYPRLFPSYSFTFTVTAP